MAAAGVVAAGVEVMVAARVVGVMVVVMVVGVMVVVMVAATAAEATAEVALVGGAKAAGTMAAAAGG